MKIGLALSGGGIRGIAHAGVLQAFEENNIKIDIIGGTSSGSLVATLYALGYSPKTIYALFKKNAKELTKLNTSLISRGIGNFFKNKKININGLKTGKGLEDIYNTLALKKGITNISEIKMPLVIPTVDISEMKEYIFTSIQNKKQENYITDAPIGSAIRASSSFPVVFCPYKYKNHIFIDGGALDNTPAIELKKQGANKIISVKFESDNVDEKSNIMDIAMKVIDIMGSKVSKESLNMSDFVITIPSDGTGLLESKKIDYCYRSGFETTYKIIDELKRKINI